MDLGPGAYIRIHMGTNICIYVYMYMCICIVIIGTNIPNFEVTCPGHLTLKCTGQAMTYHSKVPSIILSKNSEKLNRQCF